MNPVVEIFSTNKRKQGYTTAVTITYFLDWAFIHGFSSTPKFSCHREVKNHLKSKGVTKAFVVKQRGGVMRPVEWKIAPKKSNVVFLEKPTIKAVL